MEQYCLSESLLRFEERFGKQGSFLNYTQRKNFNVVQPFAAKADETSFNTLIPPKHKPNLNMHLSFGTSKSKVPDM